MSTVRIPLFVALLAPVVLTRCDCGEEIVGLPVPDIEVLDDAGNSHIGADPWLTVAFGDADSGQQVTRPLTVKNIGSAPLAIASVCVVNAEDAEAAKAATCITGQTTAFQFASIAGSEIKRGESAEMVVTFAPQGGGPARLFLQIGSNAEQEPVVAVELTGRGTDGQLCVDPNTLHDFGDVDIGVTAAAQLRVYNCGVKPVTIDSFAFAQNPDDAFTFTVATGDPVGATLAENEGLDLDVTFTPQQAGPYRDTRAGDIRINTGAPFAVQYDILLVGNGIVPPSCKVNVVPDVVNFNAVASNTTATRQVIIQSVGQCGCTVDSITGPEPLGEGFALGALPTLPFVLKGTTGCDEDPAGVDAAPSNLTFDVTYTSPDRQVPEADNATLTVTTSDLVEPEQIVNLEANGGGAPFCQLDVSPSSGTGGGGLFQLPTQGRTGVVEFGRTSVHVPKRLPITLTNIGNTTCTVSSVAYDNPENTVANEFSLEDVAGNVGIGNTPIAVEPGDTLTYFAVFSPTQTISSNNPFSFGSYSASNNLCGFVTPNERCNGVTFVTNDTETPLPDLAEDLAQGEFSIGFSGTPVEPDVDVIPGELDFGVVSLDCGSPEQRVTVYNNGGADLVVGQPVIDPATTPETFVVEATTAPSFPHAIPPGGSMAINVRYYARTLALETANLVIPTTEGAQAGPPVLVPLQGEGTTEVAQTDIFDQLNDPKVDVLWVIDDSGSMSPFQAELGQNFDRFFVDSGVTAADYHIAVTTTLTTSAVGAPPTCSVDADCGAGGDCILGLCTAGNAVNSAPDDPMSGYYSSCAGASERFISPASANAEASFECNVRVSDAGNVNPNRPASDSAEGGLRAALKFLSPPNITDPAINGGFLRDDAKLHVIMVSDEPEQSKGGVQQYIDFFKNVKGFRNEGLVAVSAIAAPPNGCNYQGTTLSDTRYKAVVDEMNGRFQEICNSDWSGMMSQLGLDSLGLRVEFFLTRAATEQTLQVCVREGSASAPCTPVPRTSAGAANGYFYDSVTNSIVFNGTDGNDVPTRGSRIEVQYNAFCFE